MKAYIIVRGGNLDVLEEKVEEFAVEGYIPTGGVSILANNYVQAVYHAGILAVMQAASREPITTYIPHSKKTGPGECTGIGPHGEGTDKPQANG